MFGLFSLRIFSVCQIDHKVLSEIYNNCSCFLPLLRCCPVYLFFSDSFSSKYTYRDPYSISIVVRFVFVIFRSIFVLVFLSYLACVVSFFYNCCFFNPVHFALICHSSRLLLLEIRSSLLYILYFFLSARIELFCLFLFLHNFVSSMVWVHLPVSSLGVLASVVN